MQTRDQVVEVEVRLRPKNQITLPDAVAAVMGAQPADRFVLTVDKRNPEGAQLRRLRRSYAGVAAGVYGAADEVADYVRHERESWNE
ncbi:MAG: AbrB/MazE/SpoVT family DNA-binding domain-containing protein [Chloroflexi bacterium]|nr:AbrB/MazE/SpoVT family DNA-binding domain-containing protein [Chloroflexota bacterium]